MCGRASTILTSQSGSKYQHGTILGLAAPRRILMSYRCFLFQGSFELAWHNNLYRAYVIPASVADREVRWASPSHSYFAYRSCSLLAQRYLIWRSPHLQTPMRSLQWKRGLV